MAIQSKFSLSESKSASIEMECSYQQKFLKLTGNLRIQKQNFID